MRTNLRTNLKLPKFLAIFQAHQSNYLPQGTQNRSKIQSYKQYGASGTAFTSLTFAIVE
jgi:hypothetical protein